MCLLETAIFAMDPRAIKKLTVRHLCYNQKANRHLHHAPSLWPGLKNGSFKYQLWHLWAGWFGEIDVTSHLVVLVPVKKE